MTPRLNVDDIQGMGLGHLVQAIRSEMDGLTFELATAHGDTNGTANKSAAQRARVRMTNLRELGKAYRKATTQSE